jgi:hypothetical protein
MTNEYIKEKLILCYKYLYNNSSTGDLILEDYLKLAITIIMLIELKPKDINIEEYNKKISIDLEEKGGEFIIKEMQEKWIFFNNSIFAIRNSSTGIIDETINNLSIENSQLKLSLSDIKNNIEKLSNENIRLATIIDNINNTYETKIKEIREEKTEIQKQKEKEDEIKKITLQSKVINATINLMKNKDFQNFLKNKVKNIDKFKNEVLNTNNLSYIYKDTDLVEFFYKEEHICFKHVEVDK